MTWRNSLPELDREIVEDCTRKMEGLNWQKRQDVLEAALERTFQLHNGKAGTLNANARRESAGIMVAAVLEKLGAADTVESDLARVFAMTADA